MRFIILIILLSMALIRIKRPLFESVFGLVLLTPILSYFFGLWVAPLGFLNLIVLLGLGVALAYFSEKRTKAEVKEAWKKEGAVVLFFCVAFTIIHYLCLLWPDFIATGERLRDYALLASVIHSPVEMNEPWMAGYNLNYYAYWYRLGHFFASTFGLEVWEVYHELQGFTFAFFLCCLYRICRLLMGFSPWSAFVSAFFISFASNIAGVVFAFSDATNWWGPSRVIHGAINEFPAWSFLLGDLHPHYLNLAFVPFIILAFYAIFPSLKDLGIKPLMSLAFLSVPFFWLYNSNAWEFPVLLGATLVFICLQLVIKVKGFGIEDVKEFLAKLFSKEELFRLTIASLFLLVIALCFSLYHSSTYISSGGHEFKEVTQAIGRTAFSDLMKHWGAPLSLVALSLVFLMPNVLIAITAFVLLTASAYYCSDKQALLFIIFVYLFNLGRLGYRVWLIRFGKEGYSKEAIILESVGITALTFLLIPEFVFLDDPYGGDHERMNTIFKFYSANWALLHLFAFYLLSLVFKKYLSKLWFKALVYMGQVVVLGCFCAFFFKTAMIKKMSEFHIKPYEQGLSSIDKIYPGAAAAIKALSDAPYGVVLEAQDNPYSYTTHVSTLAAKPAFLGWANHVNLLVKDYAEVNRRTGLTKQIYTQGHCEAKRVLLKQNNIDYLVFGPIERAKYLGATRASFKCLKELVREGRYTVYEP